MSQAYYVVLIETASNQRTIFQTNRLRENLGASEQIHGVGTRYVIEAAIKALNGDGRVASRPWDFDKLLANKNLNPPIERTGAPADAVEIVIATSGKAILIAKDRTRAEDIVTFVTKQTLLKSPGVSAHGAVVEFTDTTVDGLNTAIFQAHLRLERLASILPSNERRFARLPLVEDCRSSGMPAQIDWRRNAPKGPIASSLACRRDVFKDARRRLHNALLEDGERWRNLKLVQNIDRIENERGRWLAIVHADGNGLGKIFMDFKKHLPPVPNGKSAFRHYIDTLRAFSVGIDQCTRRAARRGIDHAWKDTAKYIPFIPVVLGGDDLTILCEGAKAIDFTVEFLRAFEDETARCPEVKAVAEHGLSACAGVAIVKPHFPFHRAYELAEGLIKQAKAVKTWAVDDKSVPVPCSAFDFQILFDSSGGDLEPIRARMAAVNEPNTRLTFRPYVVTDHGKFNRVTDAKNLTWLTQHHLDRLLDARSALEKKVSSDEPDQRGDRSVLPRTQQHALREALHDGIAASDARLKEIEHRYPIGWDALRKEKSLFFPAVDKKGDFTRTYLIDAMDLIDLASAGERS